MAALEDYLFLVHRPDHFDEGCRRLCRHDVVVLGGDMQERTGDGGQVNILAGDGHSPFHQRVFPDQFLSRLAKVFASERENVAAPAIEHTVGLDEVVVPHLVGKPNVARDP